MKPDAMERWRARRAKGRVHFVLKQGVLLWGVPVFLIMSFVMPVLFGEEQPSTPEIALNAVIFIVITAPLLGYFVWGMNERAYNKAVAQKAMSSE